MHTINQVFVGVISGGYCLYLVIRYFEAAIIELLNKLIHRDFAKSTYVLLILTSLYLIFSIIPVMIYYYNSNFHPPEVWTVWYPQVCADYSQYHLGVCEEKNFTYIKVFFDSSTIGVSFGILFGFYMSYCNYDPNELQKAKISWRLFFARSGVWFVIYGIIITIYLMIPKPESYVLMYIFKLNLDFFAVLVVILIIPFLNNKLKLDVPGDFLRKTNDVHKSLYFKEENEENEENGENGEKVLKEENEFKVVYQNP